ncbi:MAG: RnfABCDGE type electron transport complex subunit D [Anaerolineae bacterium]
MIRAIDNALNRITMYRLVLYYLIFLLGVAVLLSFRGILGYDPFALLFTIGFFIAVCWVTNKVFSKIWGVPANVESVYISALILALIITPYQGTQDLWFFVWAGVWAMASKYIVAVHRRHIFNPVAFAVALTYFTINGSASWWVGSAPMLPFALIGGLLVVRKIERFDLVGSFLLGTLATTLLFSILGHDSLLDTLQHLVMLSPLVFFACVFLTEPLTTPPTRKLRLFYGALVGVLFTPDVHIGGLYTTPELAILVGNLFSFLVSPRSTLVLRLKNKVQLAPDIYEFVFARPPKFSFAPGQYMEWTMALPEADSRGNRRYFTLASSPTEDTIRLGVKFYEHSSAYKQTMLEMDSGAEIIAGHLAGDFVLPDNPAQACVFIAGGIGITPFRSMLQYLIDRREKRPVTVIYVVRKLEDIVYDDVLRRAQRQGVRVLYALTDAESAPSGWLGHVGYVTPELIKSVVPNCTQALYYISGPRRMVESLHDTLDQVGIQPRRIKTDYFAGLA